MPRQFDLHPVPIDRDPLWSLYTGSAIPNLPKLEINAEFVWQAFINGVKALTGIDLSSWEALLDSLREQFNLDVADAMRVVTNLKAFFANAVDLSEIDFDPQQAARDFVRFIVQPLLRVIDQIKAALLGPVPIGLLTDQLDTLVLEGGFEAPETIAEGSGWVHDEMDGGCAMVECDGTDHQMSSSFIRVAPGWQLELSARWHWQGLTAAPESLRIELQPWADESTPVGAPIVLLSAGSASGSSGGWQAMTAPSLYSVPATGVRFVTLVPRVTDNATAGTVRLKDVKLVAVQRIPQNFTVDLPEDLASLFNWIGSLVDQLLARLGITPTGGLLDRIFDLADELAMIQETAEDALSTDVWQDFLDAAAGHVGGTIHHIIDRIVNLDLFGRFDASQLTNIANIPTVPGTNVGGVGGVGSIVSDLQQTWNNFWGALVGRQADDDVSLADPTEQIAELAATTAAHSSAIAQLMANQDGNTNQGVVGGDDFERVSVGNLGGGWAEFYSLGPGNGYYDTSNGHEAVWHDEGASTNTGTFVRTDPADERTETDFQRITFVVGTVAGEYPLPFIGTGGQHIRLWARVNDDADTAGITDGVFIEVGGASQAQFGYRKNGTTTMVGSTVSCTWGVGTRFTIDAGTADGVETFRFYKNGSPMLTWKDSSGVTSYGEDFRRWGWEGQARARGLGQGTPSSCARITIADNAPTAVYGTTMRVFRTNTSGVSMPVVNNTAGSPLPANVFDSIAYKSDDLDWNPATNTVTFLTDKPATYHVQCRIEFSSALGWGAYLLVLYKNGAVYAYNCNSQFPANIGLAGSPVTTIIGEFTVYAEPGDYIQMYRINTDAKDIVGGFGGAVTFLTVARMG